MPPCQAGWRIAAPPIALAARLPPPRPAAAAPVATLHPTSQLAPSLDPFPTTTRLVRDFLECAPSMSVEDAIDTLSQTGAGLLKMVHTHEGAGAACMALAYGSARDRKRLVRAMKGHVRDLAVNEWGHVVLCMALAVVDDTALLGKMVVPEIKVCVCVWRGCCGCCCCVVQGARVRVGLGWVGLQLGCGDVRAEQLGLRHVAGQVCGRGARGRRGGGHGGRSALGRRARGSRPTKRGWGRGVGALHGMPRRQHP